MYSVLCHSLVAHRLAVTWYPEHGDVFAQGVLLHDAHEAILGDTPTTWKIDQVRGLESQLDQRIALELMVPILLGEQYDEMRRIDAACLAAEAHALGHAQAARFWPIEGFGHLESDAYDLTQQQLNYGNNHRFLSADLAIRAMDLAFHEPV